MKIGIDISQITYQGTGVARYTQNLIQSLAKYDKNNEYIFFFSSLRGHLPENINSILSSRIKLKQFFIPPTLLELLWNRLHRLPIEKLIGNLDIFFSSDWVEPPTISAKKITTVHDLIPYKFPETSHSKFEFNLSDVSISPNIVATQKRRLSWVKKESDIIICDSEATKKDIEAILQIDSKKLVVVYPGIEIPQTSPHTLMKVKSKYKLDHDFILTVGKIEPRKNIVRLIKAFQTAKITNLDLCIVGPKGWENSNLNSQENIRFLGFVPDDDLYALYKQAEFFIYPSLYEGFGYPIVEAMTLGCPVATSNNSSLGEIAKNTGLLFNPESIPDINKAILQYHNNEALRKRMADKGLEHAKNFTLEKFAINLLSVFKQVIIKS